ncbi:uncharacterized protein BJ171DRAFT_64885 [Polychytrium aggregatum]|uniref:uncharacterized protein n=1 Tax=Polychytrium aggregatum TaxID=110093 RepID=UPI0022FE4E50|nr:uncharacterized protein BJ171DRAFT_64885 [Polychytrium aggregatum]KAI9205691.1 hypothetical protein BJ171DRAFT_64885 [Polychytrium aggregatum]
MQSTLWKGVSDRDLAWPRFGITADTEPVVSIRLFPKEWQHKYIDYRVLKKAIKKIEARKQQEAHIRKDEYAPQKIGNTGDNDDDGEEMDEQMGEPVGSIPMGERIEIHINDGSALGSQRDDSAESSSGDLAVPLRRKSFKSQLPEQSSNSLKFFFKKRRRSLIKETEYFPDFLETANEEEVLFFAMLNQEVQKANQFYEAAGSKPALRRASRAVQGGHKLPI